MPKMRPSRHSDSGDEVHDIDLVSAVDQNPDFSWLEDESRYKGVPAEEAEKYRREDKERLESYGDDWHMIGMWAQAEVVVDGVVQTIRSGGLWGIESDSNKEYLMEIAREEYNALKGILRKMGFKKIPPMPRGVKEVF